MLLGMSPDKQVDVCAPPQPIKHELTPYSVLIWLPVIILARGDYGTNSLCGLSNGSVEQVSFKPGVEE